MLAMRASLLAHGGCLASAHSHSGHSLCSNGVVAAGRIRGLRPACALPARGPASARDAASAPLCSASALGSGPAALVRGGSSPLPAPAAPRSGHVQAPAAGQVARSSGTEGGRDPEDDLRRYDTLESLLSGVTRRLPVWAGRNDCAAISAAFAQCAKLAASGAGSTPEGAQTRDRIVTALSAAYLPLVPRIRKAVDCSLPLWALGKAGAGSTKVELAEALLQRLIDPDVLNSASAQNLSNAFHGLGSLRELWKRQGLDWDPDASPQLHALAGDVKTRLTAAVENGFAPQNISNVLWACAKLGYRDPELLQRLADAAAALADSMNEQNLTNSLWALKALGCTGAEYLSAVQALCGEALRRLRNKELASAFQPQNLSNILLALEGLQQGGEQAELVAAVAAEDVRRGFERYKPQDLSNSAWALAKMGFGSGPEAPADQRQWFTAAVKVAMRPGAMARATPQAWSNLLYALALARHQPPLALLDAGAAAALQTGSGQQCANTLWALAVLRLRHAGLEAAVCGRLGELLERETDSLAHQHIANSLWALAVLGDSSSPGLKRISVQMAREALRRQESFPELELLQLWQAQQELGGEVAAALGSSPDLQAAMAAAVQAEHAKSTPSLKQQQQQQHHVYSALQRLQQDGGVVESVQVKAVVPGVLGRVEAMPRLRGGRDVAVDWVDPNRFFSNRKGDPTAVDGPSALRNRQLRRALGEGAVLRVPYWDWASLKSPAEQEAYLLRRLQQLQQAAPPPAASTAAGGSKSGGEKTTPMPAPSSSLSSLSSSKGGSDSSGPSSPQLLARPARRGSASGIGGSGP